MRNVIFAALVMALGLTACGYSEEDFATDFSDAYCAKLTECKADMVAYYVGLGMDEATAGTTADTTIDAVCNPPAAEGDDDTTEEATCTWNGDNAKLCVDGITAAACEESAMGFAMPAECSKTCE